MEKFGRMIVKFRIPIFILSLLLLIPAVIGYVNTKVNYDILYYLPDNIETMQGQDILLEEFGTGAYSMFVCEGMQEKDVAALKEKIEQVENVDKVIWFDTFADLSLPMEMLPDELYEAFNSGDSTMMFIIFNTTTSADETMDAIHEIRTIAGEQCFLAGMSSIVTDTKDLCESQIAIYVAIATILALFVLSLTMDNFLTPIFFLISIGIAIVYNMGSNILLGETSYITQSLAAVLQLGVTMDYSIFLWHSYEEKLKEVPEDHQEAMARAIGSTLKSVIGSSITTVAGFVALCFMSFTLGLDLGVVMAKGVVLGVICCVTVLPSMLMLFDKILMKTHHRQLLPSFPRVSRFIVYKPRIFAVLLLCLFIPFAYFQAHTNVYYNLDTSLPDYLESTQANQKLNEEYHMGAAHMVLLDTNISQTDKYKMIEEMKQVDGVKSILGLETLIGPTVPMEFVPDSITGILSSDNGYEMLLVTNEYATATDEVNAQIEELNSILKRYDPTGMLVGEAPCTKDLINITDQDFATVNTVSIGLVFLIIMFVFKSISIPIVLILVIEGAIFMNMGIPYLTGSVLPFIASIVISTIQLGATVDYAILFTSRYEKERIEGKNRKEAILISHQVNMVSVMVSALSFFAATFGVALYSDIDMISALCLLMARGAIISMFFVLLFLPAMLYLFDPIIIRTSLNFRRAGVHLRKETENK